MALGAPQKFSPNLRMLQKRRPQPPPGIPTVEQSIGQYQVPVTPGIPHPQHSGDTPDLRHDQLQPSV